MNPLVIFLVAGLAVVSGSGRPSPNADRVMEYLKRHPGLRYTDDAIADALVDVPQLIARHNYPSEVHHVTTADGYILELHRIPHGRDRNNQPGSRTPVLLLHGLLSSSADYLNMGPGTSIGYVLAEEGYDVWLGNSRGNYYSRNHTTLDPGDRNNLDFWRFSWDQMGEYDLPATIDYILEVTGQPKLHYIGHSQGGAEFFVLCSLRPEYNEKILSFQGMAPATFFTYNVYAPLIAVSKRESQLEALAFEHGLVEVWTRSEVLTWIGVNICANATLQSLCLNYPFLGDIFSSMNSTMVATIFGHAPAGASIRQFTHFFQSVNHGAFRRYDYGPKGNVNKYKQIYPPDYNLSLVTAPIYIHYGLNDDIVYYEDIYVLARSLPTPPVLHRLPRVSFSHTDFVWGYDARDTLNPVVLQYMREAENAGMNISEKTVFSQTIIT